MKNNIIFLFLVMFHSSQAYIKPNVNVGLQYPIFKTAYGSLVVYPNASIIRKKIFISFLYVTPPYQGFSVFAGIELGYSVNSYISRKWQKKDFRFTFGVQWSYDNFFTVQGGIKEKILRP